MRRGYAILEASLLKQLRADTGAVNALLLCLEVDYAWDYSTRWLAPLGHVDIPPIPSIARDIPTKDPTVHT